MRMNKLILEYLQKLVTELLMSLSFSHCCCCLVASISDSVRPHPPRFLSPWDSPGKNTGVGCHFLLQGIFLTLGSNPGLLYWQVDSLPPSHLGSLIQSLGLCYTYMFLVDKDSALYLSYYSSTYRMQFLYTGCTVNTLRIRLLMYAVNCHIIIMI